MRSNEKYLILLTQQLDASLNAKINGVKDDKPNISNLAPTSAFTAV